MSPTAPSPTSARTRSYFGREAQLLGVHQLPLVLAADGDHLVGFLERHAQRLLDDDVCGAL
jgi:hypothetical protein